VSDSDKSGLVYEIPCHDCDAVNIGETGRSLKTGKREHMEAVKEMDLKSPHYANNKNVANCDHFIAWDDATILKMEPNFSKRRTAECYFINKRASEVNVINRNDGINLPYVYGMLID